MSETITRELKTANDHRIEPRHKKTCLRGF